LEVEIGGPIGSTTWGSGDVYVGLARRVACAVVIGIEVDIGILEVPGARLISSVPVAAVDIVAV
jgi:hypothetical protein